MKTRLPITTFALFGLLFTVATFADHNRIDEQGRKQGHWTEIDSYGDLSEGYYQDGEKHGPWYEEFLGDIKKETGRYVRGVRQGRWVEELYRGAFKAEGLYVDGEKDGVWIEWIPEIGTVTERKTYRNGEEVK